MISTWQETMGSAAGDRLVYDQEVQSMRHRADSTKIHFSALDLIDLFEARRIWSGRVDSNGPGL